jgi:predicted enzyme related to lactoylglutathione lyase
MARVVHFEIPTTDVEASKKFYGSVFDWKFEVWQGPEDYWMINTGAEETPGINGGFYKPWAGLTGTINTVDVADLDSTLAKVIAAGGKALTPKMPVPGVGWLCYAQDPTGASFGMMQADPSAKM